MGINEVWDIKVKAPRHLTLYLVLIHLTIIATIFLLPLSITVNLFLTLLTLISYFFYFYRYCHRHGRRYIKHLTKKSNGLWQLEYGSHQVFDDLILARSVVWPDWLILYFRQSKKSYSWHEHAVWLYKAQLSGKYQHLLRIYCRTPKTYRK